MMLGERALIVRKKDTFTSRQKQTKQNLCNKMRYLYTELEKLSWQSPKIIEENSIKYF